MKVLTALLTIALPLAVSGGVHAHPHGDNEDASHSHEEHSHKGGWTHENGVGPDPDGDGNPATDTGGLSITGDAALVTDDPPYDVITFETTPDRHGEAIGAQYKDEFGVSFGAGLTRQICEGQRRFAYDTMCTYEAAPSGAFAAGYADVLNRPLTIAFDRPVCVATMAIYPTGGKEGEPFTLTIDAWDADGATLPSVDIDFEWTKETIRWRHMAGAYYLDKPAARIAVGMKSRDRKERAKLLRFLIDDLALIEDGCEAALAEIAERAGGASDEAEDDAEDESAETAETALLAGAGKTG